MAKKDRRATEGLNVALAKREDGLSYQVGDDTMRSPFEVSSTVKLNIPPLGWCEDSGVEHSWKDGPTLTSSPPIQTRECVNCGQRQWFAPGSDA